MLVYLFLLDKTLGIRENRFFFQNLNNPYIILSSMNPSYSYYFSFLFSLHGRNFLYYAQICQTGFYPVTQAIVQWCNHSLMQPLQAQMIFLPQSPELGVQVGATMPKYFFIFILYYCREEVLLCFPGWSQTPGLK